MPAPPLNHWEIDVNQTPQDWLTAFSTALSAQDIPAITLLFHETCYWRDLLTFTWNIKTMEGQVDIAAMLVEMFPTRIRYTSMSLPYHIGNGIFGGLLPAVATYLAAKASTANEVAIAAGQAITYDKPYLEGLWYPIIIGGVCFVIGLLYVNGKDKEIND